MRETKRTSEKHAKLKELGAQCKQNIYDMLRLANDILSDPDYVDQFGGESALIEYFEKNEFGYFGGNPSLPALIRAYRKNPTEEMWKRYDYNVRAMIDLSVPKKQTEHEKKISWKDKCLELEERIKGLENLIEYHEKRERELEDKCNLYVKQIGQLEGRIEEMERSVAAV